MVTTGFINLSGSAGAGFPGAYKGKIPPLSGGFSVGKGGEYSSCNGPIQPQIYDSIHHGYMNGRQEDSRFDNDETGGLLAKGFTAAKAGASALAGGAQVVASQIKVATGNAASAATAAASAATGSSAGGVADDDIFGSSGNFGFGGLSSQRLIYFGLAAGVGALFMTLSFLFLPMLMFAPSKFAMLFTLGSMSFMCALGVLKGFKSFFQHLISYQRLPFTFAYSLSLISTLYATLVAKSYLLTLFFSVVQLVALASFLVSYIPGGTSMLKFMAGGAWQMLRKIFRCGDSRDTSSLPL